MNNFRGILDFCIRVSKLLIFFKVVIVVDGEIFNVAEVGRLLLNIHVIGFIPVLGRGRFTRGRPYYGNYRRIYSSYSNYTFGPGDTYGPPRSKHHLLYISISYSCFVQGFYSPGQLYGPPMDGRINHSAGIYGPNDDLSEQEGFNDYPISYMNRGLRRGRGRNRHRGSFRRYTTQQQKFVLNQEQISSVQMNSLISSARDSRKENIDDQQRGDSGQNNANNNVHRNFNRRRRRRRTNDETSGTEQQNE